MIVYHGTSNVFTKFDYNKIGQHGSSEGKGFYFTDKKEIAETYADNGYVIVANFKGENPLHYTQKTISKLQLKKYLRELHKTTGCLNNYDDVEHFGIEKVLSKAIEMEYSYCTNDVDLICSICNGCGDTENGLKTLYKVLGYDSIQVPADWGEQNLFIALVNEAIEIIETVPINEWRLSA